MKRVFFFIAFVIALSSCTMYEEVKVSDVQDVVVGEINDNGIVLQIYFTIDNPNWYSLKLKESKIDVFVENTFFGTIDQFEEIVIPKNSSTSQVLRVTAKPEVLQSLLGNALKLFFTDELKLEAKGYVRGKALLINKKIDIQVTEKMSKADFGL